MRQFHTVFSPSHSYNEIVVVQSGTSPFTLFTLRTRPMVGLRAVDRSCMRLPSVDPGGYDVDSSVPSGVTNPTHLGLNRIRLERTERVFSLPAPDHRSRMRARGPRMLSGVNGGDNKRSSYEVEVDPPLPRPQKKIPNGRGNGSITLTLTPSCAQSMTLPLPAQKATGNFPT
mmetsp:Transcript_5874/g.36425  ORF Transcript_5874/g.36425 Transcript_5874/m.36425 type:complete len:172 (-) Transcript_5874:1037-1552(-)